MEDAMDKYPRNAPQIEPTKFSKDEVNKSSINVYINSVIFKEIFVRKIYIFKYSVINAFHYGTNFVYKYINKTEKEKF